MLSELPHQQRVKDHAAAPGVHALSGVVLRVDDLRRRVVRAPRLGCSLASGPGARSGSHAGTPPPKLSAGTAVARLAPAPLLNNTLPLLVDQLEQLTTVDQLHHEKHVARRVNDLKQLDYVRVAME